MKKTILLITTLIAASSCSDKFEVPEFSDPTLEITQKNHEEVIFSAFLNFEAKNFSEYWLLDGPIDIEDDFDTTHTLLCDSGNVFGDINDGKSSNGKFQIDATLTFYDCIFNQPGFDGISIAGIIDYEVDYAITSTIDQAKGKVATKGSYAINYLQDTYSFNNHYNEREIKPNSNVIKGYSQVSIESSIASGTVNYFTDIPIVLLDNGIINEGIIVILGANNTSIEIDYSKTPIELYLNGSLIP